ncbi:MAG: AAA family ATPase [Actinobacteria bacterium]|nr:AAA family ATPase [Actinomycetota bacterium]
MLGGSAVLRGRAGDVARERERHRRRRLLEFAIVLTPLCVYLYHRILSGDPVRFGWPQVHLPEWLAPLAPGLILVGVLALVLVVPLLAAGRSPHALYRPSEIPVALEDVVGLGIVRDEVVKTLNLFLAYQTFRDRMGGNPRKAILFEGPPGTGKTYMAKAMAREASVPFLFVSASAFQSMYYGQTNRKIRVFFRTLRKTARREGGAIGFIEEIDAIAGARGGMRDNAVGIEVGRTVARADMREGIAGVVNELLIQMQSFDEPTVGGRMRGWAIDRVNRMLPTERQLRKKPPVSSNILVIGATNRADNLDPALLRPGRFDRSIHFGLPSRGGRREIIDYYLDRKAHVPELDKEERRDQLAAMTFGYSPVMIEHLFDEALVWCLREGREAMEWADVQQAKLTEEIGLAQPVEYTEDEKRTIATHEAGHAVVAHLVGVDRKLEVLSIIKRKDALGLLAHSDTEERYTRTRSELVSSIQIGFGGITAEELFFGESGTGPASDLAHTTALAARMVGSFGMAGSLLSFEAVEAGPITQGIVAKVLADEESRRSVERILESAKDSVRDLLDANRDLVIALRDALLEHEELVGDEILEVLRRAQAEREPLATDRTTCHEPG